MNAALPWCAALGMPYWRANLILCLTAPSWREWQGKRDMSKIIPAIDALLAAIRNN